MAKSKKKRAERIRQLWQGANGVTRQQWESRSQKGYDFFLDNQLSSSEKSTLESQGMPTFTINRITPVIEMLCYYATASQPRWQAVGREASDSDVAAVFADVMSYVWDLSNGQSVYSNVITDTIAKGLGWILVDVDPDADKGKGEVVLRQVEPYDIYVDPKSRHPLFEDAGYIIVRKNLPRQHLMSVLPRYAKQIKKANGQTSTDISYSTKARDGQQQDFQYKDITESWTVEGEQDEVLEFFEVYYKKKKLYYNVFYRIPPTQQEMQQIKAQVQQQLQSMAEELEVQLKEQALQIQMAVQQQEMIPERAELEMKKAQEAMEMQLKQAEMELTAQAQEAASVVEQKVVSEEEMKILVKNKEFQESLVDAVGFYQTVVIRSCMVGDELLYETAIPSDKYPIVPFMYRWTGTPYPMSAVMPLIGKQQEVNKAHQLMIHNASLGSSLRWIYDHGAIDEKYWSTHGSAPGALLPKNPGFDAPAPIMPMPLSNAFGQIIAMDKMDMEYLSGMWSSMMGDVQSQHDTYRGLLANDEYGTRRVKNWLKNLLEPALKHLGEVVRDYSQSLYTAHKVLRIVQPNNIENLKKVEINVPIYNDYGEAIGKWNDYETARFDIQIVAGSSLPVNRWAYLAELRELLQLGVVDDIAVLAETDIRNKEKIVQRKSMYAQMKGQIESLEEQLKDSTGTNETLERQLVQAGIREEVSKAKGRLKDQESTEEKKITDRAADTAMKQKFLQRLQAEEEKEVRQKKSLA